MTENKPKEEVKEPQIIGWAKDDKYSYTFSQQEFEYIQQLLEPYRLGIAILNMKFQQAQAEGGIRPILEEDKQYIVSKPDGTNYITEEFWKKFEKKEEKKSNLITDSLGNKN